MEPRFLAILALAILAFGAVSRRAEHSPLTPPIVFLALGLFLGKLGLGWMELDVEASVVHGLAELTLILVLFIDAARIDFDCLRREGTLPLRMLALGMPLTIAFGALLALGLLPELQPVEAFLLAAVLAPTDAALGQAVVSSPLVPVRIRQSLNVESGLNDGIALPVVLVLAAFAASSPGGEDAGSASSWLRFAALQVTLGPIVGAAVGWAGGQLIGAATRRGFVNEAFEQLAAIGLALLAFASAELVHGNGFIAAFVAGLVVGNTARGLCHSLYEFGEAEGQLLTLLVFLVFGAVMVPQAWPHVDGRMLVYALLSLTLVRMVPVGLSLLGTGLLPASYLFLGWFGPRGLASILFALLVVEGREMEGGGPLLAVVTLTVTLSVLLHGASAYPLAWLYARHVGERRGEADAEHLPALEMPVRVRHGAAKAVAMPPKGANQ